MISKKSLNVLFGILVSLMIICGIHIIVMILKQEIVTSFYVFAGMTILCSVVYIIAFLRMRYLIKNQQKYQKFETFLYRKRHKQEIKESNNKSKDIIKQNNYDTDDNNLSNRSDEYSSINKVDDYNKIEEILNFYQNGINSIEECENLNNKLKNIEMSPINFSKLDSQVSQVYELSNNNEMNIAKMICMPLKRNGYLDSANKIYKFILHKYGLNEFLMKDWSKIFTCNRQFDMAQKLMKIGINAYKVGLKNSDIPKQNRTIISLMGGYIPCECELHLADLTKAINANDVDYYIKSVGGDPCRNITYSLN